MFVPVPSVDCLSLPGHFLSGAVHKANHRIIIRIIIIIRVWARIWSLGDNLSPWLNFWGTFLFLGGTDKLIFIQHFFYIHTGKLTKTFFFYLILVVQEKWYKQEKLSFWCRDFFSSYLNRGSMTRCSILQNISQQNLVPASPCKLQFLS